MATTFIPLNKFKSVLSTLTGNETTLYTTPTGVSTIILSSQFTNMGMETETLTVYLDANTSIPNPNLDTITNTGSYTDTVYLLELNKDFIVSEVTAYTQFRNTTSPTPFALNPNEWKRELYRVVDGIIADLTDGGAKNTETTIIEFYDKDGNLLIQNGRVDEMIVAIDYVNTVSQQVIRNTPITESVDVVMLYQTSVTQSYDNGYTFNPVSDLVIAELTDAITLELQTPTMIVKPKSSVVYKVPIPTEDSLSPVISGKLVLESGYSLIASGSSNISVVLSLLESANE
jgi:hypothetical protein